MTTLYSSILTLHASHDGALQPTQGHHALAAFYNLVEQVDPELSALLHDTNARKPFTLSTLNELPALRDPSTAQSSRSGQVAVRLRAGHECWLRVTLASDAMFQTFISRFMHPSAGSGQVARPTIRLGEMEFGVSAVLTAPGSHAWAGYTTVEDLMANARTSDTLTFEFASPVSFSLGDNRMEIMPRPELVFIGLHRKWQEWCGLPTTMKLSADWLRERVLVSQWEMRSHMWRYGKQHQIGSEGRVTYRVFDADEDTLYMLNTLADFAFYAGVGRKTTQGMGQVRRMRSGWRLKVEG